ncbi:hypothetical protein K435DRAFT_971672 [Dendrothele bispora CBS 962.96]|uniref:Uncharacterized protein n=1 Tax=Dendrothele bispora (strain CBS 962.96) TaxID=1314807 RepID=A0A4S8L3P9_DENBC|nr:hypothetical protein K435DRAFT_971672 [Dendrothele bispora CBS 962.96]
MTIRYPLSTLEVWHQFKIQPHPMTEEVTAETVKAIPLEKNFKIDRFDTVVVMVSEEAESASLTGCRIGTLRVIFRLPEQALDDYQILTQAPQYWPRTHLAYVEWFSQPTVSSTHGLPTTSRSTDSNGRPMGAVIPLSDIRQTCMLTPDFAAKSTAKNLDLWDKKPAHGIEGMSKIFSKSLSVSLFISNRLCGVNP